MEISKRSRELYDALAQGWDTWDGQSVTAHVLLPDQLRIHAAIIVPHLAGYSGNNLWNSIETFGEHAVDGSYTEVDIRYMDGVFRVETTAEGHELLIRVTPLKKRGNTFVALEVSGIWGGRVDIEHRGNAIIAKSSGGAHTVRALGALADPGWNPSVAANLVCPIDETAYFTVNSDRTAREVDRAIDGARERWLQGAISADGGLGDGLAAMRRSLLWNKVYEPRNRRVITPVSREWCRLGKGCPNFGDYVLFGWDTFFASLQYGLVDKRLAYSAMFSILEEMTPEGMAPNFGSAVGKSDDRSEPQVGALCAWKLYQQFGDRWFLEECFDCLLTWNRWRFRERDFNSDGLLELGSVPTKAGEEEGIWNTVEYGLRQGAMWESGIDNSPMWDRAVFNDKLHCLELSYAGENALMVADCDLLAKIAALLGREEEQRELEQRSATLAEKIDTELWNEEAGCYMNKHWSGEFDPCMSLTHFYAMLGNIGGPERTGRMLREHLLNPEEFWGEYVIPNISRKDPTFPEQDYWRGRIWGPTNYLVGEGLLRAGQTEIFETLAEKGLGLFVRCWTEKGCVGENYNAITGEAAEPGASSDKFYHWGALLAYMAVQCAVDFSAWDDTIIYRPVPSWLPGIRNLPVRGGTVDIRGNGGVRP